MDFAMQKLQALALQLARYILLLLIDIIFANFIES